MKKVLSLLVCVVALLIGTTSPANASDGISFSRDGTNWSETLSEPIFAESIRWVPGDVRTGSFYVRSDAEMNTLMSVDVLTSKRQELIDTGDLLVEVRIAGGTWEPTTTAGTNLLATQAVAAGDFYLVEVRATFLGEATNQSELLGLDLRFRVTLTQEVTPGGVTAPPLALTGAAAGIGLIFVLVVLYAVFMFFLVAIRNRKQSDEGARHAA